MTGPSPPPIARLHIERRGGLAGLRTTAECAYASLTAGERRALDEVLGAVPPLPAPPGADRFAYRLQIVHPDGSDRTLDVSEEAMPAALAALVRPTLP